jgi:hypothetical protein
MTFGKSTKGTHVYRDESDQAPIPTLYIKKDALPTDPPLLITVTIEAE